MLREILEEVRTRGLVLKYYVTGSGRMVPARTLEFRDGQWLLSEIACWSSQVLGLGNCQCSSHDPVMSEVITREEALRLLRQYMQKLVEEKRAREEEVKFFDLLIKLADLLATGSL